MTQTDWHIQTGKDPIVIIGGGPVGSIAALGLAQQGWRVTILEAAAEKQKRWGYDARTLAINLGSHRLLTELGIPVGEHWCDIGCVRVTQTGRSVTTLLTAESMQTEALGYTIVASELGRFLDEQLEQHPNIELRLNTKLSNLRQNAQSVKITTSQSEVMETPFVLACDGANSPTRNALNIPADQHDFNQTAILSRLTHSAPHTHIAQERFLANGVFALLPLPDTETGEHRSSMVWIQPAPKTQHTLGLNETDFLAQINQTFDGTFGDFTHASAPISYPIKQTLAKQYASGRIAFLGNAAHALHPIAGQGLNIGIRDVAKLVEQTGASLNGQQIQHWSNQRRRDALTAARLTRAMVLGFSLPGIKQIAGLSLLGIEKISPLKRQFTRYMMGL